MNLIKKTVLVLLSLCLSSQLHAKFPQKPANFAYINDFGNYLSKSHKLQLEQEAISFRDKTGIPVFVFLPNEEIGTGSQRMINAFGHSWQLYDQYDGKLIIIVTHPPFKGKSGSAFIAGGEATSSLLSFGILAKTENDVLIPFVENGNFYNGILETMNHLQEKIYFAKRYLTLLILFIIVFLGSPVLYFFILKLRPAPVDISLYEIADVKNYDNVSKALDNIESKTGKDLTAHRLKIQNRFSFVIGKKRNKKLLETITLNELLCLLMNGKGRFQLFWHNSSISLKVCCFIVILFPGFLHIYWIYLELDQTTLTVASIVECGSIPFFISLMCAIIEIPARSKTRKSGQTALAKDWFAIKALTCMSFKKYFDPKTGEKYYKYKKPKKNSFSQIIPYFD